jgi:FkbM family methyltransferase
MSLNALKTASYRDLINDGFDVTSAHDLKRVDDLRRSRVDLDYAGRPLILLGAGSMMARAFVQYCVDHFNVRAIVDNGLNGQELCGRPVIGDETLREVLAVSPDAIGILCCGSEAPMRHFQQVWGARPQPLLFYFEVMTTFPKGFDGGVRVNDLLAYGDLDILASVQAFGRKILTDPESRKVLDALMIYRLTWDEAALEPVRRPIEGVYFDNDLCAPNEREIFVDGGAFDGDTVRQFIARTGGQYRHIHAFELDPINVDSLRVKTADVRDISVHAAGLWSHADSIGFETTGAMGSAINQASEVRLPVDALDNMNLGEITFVKFDIEGAEGPALDGMARTITEYKPKMALSAYHKADDIPVLAQKLLDLRPDYRFELRHYSSMIWETVLYAG